MPIPLDPTPSPDHGLIDMPDLETSDTCRSLYSSFYSNITSSQDNDTQITLDTRIKNIAYNLASPIARHIGTGGGGSGSGGTGGGVDPGLFVSKNGDTMNGKLSTLYGFATGEAGRVLMQTKKIVDETGVADSYLSVEGKFLIESANLLIDNKVILNHYTSIAEGGDILEIDGGALMKLNATHVKTEGRLEANQLIVDSDLFTYDGHDVYHAGNSNRQEVDWTSYNANVYGSLIAKGNSRFDAKLTSLFDVELGSGGERVAVASQGKLNLYKPLNLTAGSPVQHKECNIISMPGGGHIQLSAAKGALILGGENTTDIRLWSTLTTEQGDQDMVDKFGNAWFMSSFTAGHGRVKLLSTDTDRVVFHKRLAFENDEDTYLAGDSFGIQMSSRYSQDGYQNTHKTSVNIGASTSVHADAGRRSESVFVNTTADFFTFNKPIEGKEFVGIQQSATRLYDNTLFFTSEHCIVNVAEGIKHYGNSYFADNLSSERFSTGFAGEGWAIRQKTDSGSIEMTVDELVVRKKIRAYEFEVQKIDIVDGSLWVSNSCSADKVTIIN